MPDFNAIADVSLTLKDFIKQGLEAESELEDFDVEIHDLLFDNNAAPSGVTLLLFEVLEDPSARNRSRVREPDNGKVRIKKAPMALILRFLVTAWSDPVSSQKLLGRITQLFYDDAIISGNDLRGTTLSGTSEALKVRMAPLTLEERTRIWHAIQKAYRLSVTFEVRVVNIEPKKAASTPRVTNRQVEYGHLVDPT